MLMNSVVVHLEMMHVFEFVLFLMDNISQKEQLDEPSKGAYGTRRNEALWNQIVKPPDISFDAVTNYHSQWQAARTTTGSNQTPPALDQVIKWSPPPQNYIKCNLNAAGITD